MTEGNLQRIVVGVDGSQLSTEALRWAVEEARLRRVVLEVVTVWDVPSIGFAPYGFTPPPLVDPDDVERQAAAVLDGALASVAGQVEGLDVRAVTERGLAADVLPRCSEGAEMIVVGSRGHGGFAGMLLGSVGRAVAHRAACPAVIVPGPARRTGGLVVGVDGSPPSIAALRWSLGEARLRGSHLEVLHAWQYPGDLLYGDGAAFSSAEFEEVARQVLADALRAVEGDLAGVEVAAVPRRGQAVDVVVQASRQAALTIVGSHSRGGIAELLLGSVCSGVIRHASSPVVIVRG